MTSTTRLWFASFTLLVLVTGALAGVVSEARWMPALALVLFAAAGVGVENTYQTGLLVCALLILATPAANRDAGSPGSR